MSDVALGTSWSGPITVERIYEQRGREIRGADHPLRDVPARLDAGQYAAVMADLGGDVAKRHQAQVAEVADLESQIPTLWESAEELGATAAVEGERARQSKTRAAVRGTAEMKRRAKAAADDAAAADEQAAKAQEAADVAVDKLQILRTDLHEFEDEHLQVWLEARYDEAMQCTREFYERLQVAAQARDALLAAFQPIRSLGLPQPLPLVATPWEHDLGKASTSKLQQLTSDLRSWGYKL